MKTLINIVSLTAILIVVITSRALSQQTVPVEDPLFQDFLELNHPTVINDTTGELIIVNARNDINSLNLAPGDITSVAEIVYMSNAGSFRLNDNLIERIPNISGFNSLTTFQAKNNRLTEVSSMQGTNITSFNISTNEVRELPDLGNWPDNLGALTVSTNQIQHLNGVDQLTSLRFLEASRNELTSLPDLTNLNNLEVLRLGENQFSDLPNFPLDDIRILKVNDNRLTFEDIYRFAPIVDDLEIFEYAPQAVVGTSEMVSLPIGQPFTIDLGIDENVPGNKYTWLKDGDTVETTTVNSLTITYVTEESEGSYTCLITNETPGIDSLVLESAPVTLDVFCPIVYDLKLNIGEVSCYELGSVEITADSLIDADVPVVYTLENLDSGALLSNETGFFDTLNGSRYLATIESPEFCLQRNTQSFELPYHREDCEDIVIRPGNPPYDRYYISDPGKIEIYDMNGVRVNTITGPGPWTGRDASGSFVGSGYYILKTPGDKVIYVTVRN